DGRSWNRRNAGTANLLRGAAYGNGQFVIVGDAGTILQSANVILQSPTILTQPESQSAKIGANVTLNSTVLGALPLASQWRKDGVDIPGATNATLSLNSVGASDSAGYSLVVVNGYGSAASAVAYLSVLADGANGNPPAQIPAPSAPIKSPDVDSLVV